MSRDVHLRKKKTRCACRDRPSRRSGGRRGFDRRREDVETHWTCQRGLEILHLLPEVGGHGGLRGGHGRHTGRKKRRGQGGRQLPSEQQNKE